MTQAIETKRCNQCWHVKPLSIFTINARTKKHKNTCDTCAERYSGWSRLTLEEKIAKRGRRVDLQSADVRVTFVPRSGNQKLGPMPCSITQRSTCPPDCMFFEMACYADVGKMKGHWRNVDLDGLTWKKFLFEIEQLEKGTVWRHAEAGDLPGHGDRLDRLALEALVRANRGRRGFTFTHKPLPNAFDRLAVKEANARGFAINLSADSLEEVDEKASWKAGAVVVIVPAAAKLPRRTRAGHKLVECPNQTHGLTCDRCKLCTVPFRRSVVVFRAHGQGARLVPELVRAKRERVSA